MSRKSLDLYSAHYENNFSKVNFNVSIDDLDMESFCEFFGFKSVIKDPTCSKNQENPPCIDLILTTVLIAFKILV